MIIPTFSGSWKMIIAQCYSQIRLDFIFMCDVEIIINRLYKFKKLPISEKAYVSDG